MKKTANSEIGEDLFQYLPSEIILDILSRLDVRTIKSVKCVCKSWLDLLTTPEFVKSHLSKSVPCLFILIHKLKLNLKSETHKIVEGLVDLNYDWHRLNIVFFLEIPFRMLIHCSVNGLIFLENNVDRVVCNPVTREYIRLPCPNQPSQIPRWELYGFGVSRLSGQYKVVRISEERSLQRSCQVYTIGTGSWRKIGKCGQFEHRAKISVMALLCGNLHWWGESTGTLVPNQISRLDLETESFSTISGPPSEDAYKESSLSSLRGCLCVCENWFREIDIWVMKEYGDEKSWTREFSMLKENVCWGGLEELEQIEVFRNGDMLMSRVMDKPLYYSSNTKTVQQVDVDLIDSDDNIFNQIRFYTPSFLSLKTFANESVSSF